MSRLPSKKPTTDLAVSRVSLTFRRHALPILAGLAVFVAVFGFFNSELITGQIAYRLYAANHNVTSLDSSLANGVVDPHAGPRITINRIDITAPVDFSGTTVNQWAFQLALRNGVVHYPATATPGQAGNVVIFGHSSGQWWTPGNYKFVFTLLDKLSFGDKIFVDYQGKRYIYRVYNTLTVAPTDMSVLNQGGSHMLTLITCTPVGTSSARLIIQAQQISPKTTADTAFGTAAHLPKGITTQNALPSNASFWDDAHDLFDEIFKR